MDHLASAAPREAAPAIRRYEAANGRSRVAVRGGGQMTHRKKLKISEQKVRDISQIHAISQKNVAISIISQLLFFFRIKDKQQIKTM